MSSFKEKLIAKTKDVEFDIFAAFLIIMSIYYGYRMFAYAPWYDELYTYNFFISRGPIYAGIHWPVPNNHLGYSALSGFFYILTHNPYISLRGVAYLCSVGNLIMLFMLGRKLMTKGFALILPAVYAGTWQVNNITVQGRGYSLSVNMMLIALICLMHLCFDEKDKKRYYVLWAISLCIGFYTVMTTLYWAVTVCLAALFCLLCVKQTKRLIRIIIASVFGAVGTLFAYSCVWLAIGSNLLVKDEAGAYFGLSHFKMITGHPILSLKTGAEYMLATPYIQSVSSEGYVGAFFSHWYDILNHMYAFGVGLAAVMIISVILASVTLIARHRSPDKGLSGDVHTDGLAVLSWVVICFALATPLTVFVQTKLPYVRVFTFYAVSIALSAGYLLYVLFGALKPYFTYGIGVIVILLVFAQLLDADYNIPYGEKEQAILQVFEQANLGSYGASGTKICLTDCDQEYMYRFLYDEYPVMYSMEDADLIVVDREMLDPDAEYHWEFYYDHSTVDHDKLSGMKQLLRNTYYEIYITEE